MPHARAKLRPFVLFFSPSLTARAACYHCCCCGGPHMNLAGLTLLLVALAASCGAIDNGLGRTPP
jgi:hypothetical protein